MSDDERSIAFLLTPPVVPGTKVGVWVEPPPNKKATPIEYLGEAIYEGDFEFGDTEATQPIQNLEDKLAYFTNTGKIIIPRLRFPDGSVIWGPSVSWDELSNVAAILATAKSVQYTDHVKFVENNKRYLNAVQEFEVVLRTQVNVFAETQDFLN